MSFEIRQRQATSGSERCVPETDSLQPTNYRRLGARRTALLPKSGTAATGSKSGRAATPTPGRFREQLALSKAYIRSLP